MKKIFFLSYFSRLFLLRTGFVELVFLISILSLSKNSFSQNVGIGTTTPHTKAQLEVTSSSKGILIPKLTTTQRNSIVNPPPGLMIYNTTTGNFNVFDSITWKAMQKELPSGVQVLADTGQNPGLSELGFSPEGDIFVNRRFPPQQVTIEDSTWYSINQNDPDSLNNPAGNYSGLFFWIGSEALYLTRDSNFRYNPNTDRWTLNQNNFVGGQMPGLNPTIGVWTGTEVIWWNGFGNDNSEIYRFDPQTNSLTTVNAFYPSVSRTEYSLIYTGTKMIMWGGWNSQNDYFLNDGGIFDPSTNSWQLISMPFSLVLSLPARAKHSAIWTGTEMIVCGGEISYECSFGLPPQTFSRHSQTNTGFRFNPVNMQFSAITAGGGARFDHSAVWTGTEMIVYGGRNYSFQGNCSYTVPPLNTGARFNPSSGEWTITPVSSYSYSHYAFWNGDKMIVAGGTAGSNSLTTGVRCYSPTSNTWSGEIAFCPDYIFYDKSIWTGSKIISLTVPEIFSPNINYLRAHAWGVTPVNLIQAQPRTEIKLTVWRKN